MSEQEDMIAEGGPDADDRDTPQDVPAAPVPASPPYPGRDEFYSGSLLRGHLDELREALEVQVPDGQENAGFREHDRAALADRFGRDSIPDEQEWAELWRD